MATVKVASHTRKVKGKTIKVAGFTRQVKTKSGGASKKKPLTAAQKKHRHDYYEKNRTKILMKQKKKH